MAKLRLTLYDKVFRKEKFSEIFYLRNQIEYMLSNFENIDIITRIKKYEDVSRDISKFIWLTFNEEGMYRDLGEEAVIKRLKGDRDLIYNKMKDITEFDIGYISRSIRDKKLNNILC
jgi:hypothetical protein